MRIIKRWSEIIVCMICLAAPASAGQAQQASITYTPHWMPQSQFAGYYVALDRGYYRDAGLDVTIRHPSATENVVETLRNGECDVISLFLMTALEARDKGTDMVNICQLSQNSAQLFVTKASSGISRPEQLNGKRIGAWEAGFREIPEAVLQQAGSVVTWVPIVSSVNLFLQGGIDAMVVMLYNEYDVIINCGVNENELNRIFCSEHGFNIPEDGLYALGDSYSSRPDVFRRFVAASLKGWETAFAEKDYALDLVMKEMKSANVPSNRAHQQWMLDKMEELFKPGQKPVAEGELWQEDYQKAFSILSNMGRMTQTSPDFQAFYKKPGR